MSIIKNRYDISLLFDVENGNPNGDPNANNEPRQDDETGIGIISDVCLKRKIRNAVENIKNDEVGFKIFTKTWEVLNKGIEDSQKINPDGWVSHLCSNYFDIRSFGGVLSTGTAKGDRDGAITGPIQIGFSKSIDPVYIKEITITRDCVTNEKDVDNQRTMGCKYIIPYALYRTQITVNPFQANRRNTGITGFSENDMELFIVALQKMFELDRSAARGVITMRKMFVFKHESNLGNYPSHKLMEGISINKKEGVEYPRHFSDYVVEINPIVQSIKNVELTVID